MAPRVVVFDKLVMNSILLTRVNVDPVTGTVSYTISGSNDEEPELRQFAPSIPGAIAAQLATLWAQAEALARTREGL